jgi:hypothetical protein
MSGGRVFMAPAFLTLDKSGFPFINSPNTFKKIACGHPGRNSKPRWVDDQRKDRLQSIANNSAAGSKKSTVAHGYRDHSHPATPECLP